MPNKNMQLLKKKFQKHAHKFANYTKNQKLFTLFLLIFAAALVLFPLVKISDVQGAGAESIWLLSKTYFKSMIVIFSSMLFLLGWNMNIRFKSFIVNFLGFRESEPMLNFGFLWVIAGAFIGITDTLGMLASTTQRVSFAWGGKLIFVLLLIGIIISFIEVWKGANKNSQKTKILNIVDEESAPQKTENKRVLQHLFDDEELE